MSDKKGKKKIKNKKVNRSNKAKKEVANEIKNKDIKKNKIINYVKEHKWVDYFGIFLVTLSYFILLFDSEVFYTAHDLVFHISNIKSIAGDISITNIFPDKILSELVNNCGYGVNLFYPVFPHLVGAYIYFIFKDIVTTFKILDLVIIFLSGTFMYKYIYKVFKNRLSAFVGGITYISMPYLFADIFIRCALNESFLFFIIPLIFLGIHYLIEDNNKFMFYLLFVLGYVMAINSHLVLSVYLTIVIILYLLIWLKEKIFDWDIIKSFIIASIFILLLVLSFIVPLLEHYNLGIYDIFNIVYTGYNSVQTAELFRYIVPFRHLDIPIYISQIVSIGLVFLIFQWKKINKEDKNILFGIVGIIIFSLVLATCDLIWYMVPNLLKSIQFGWRMSLFVVFGSTILFCYLFKVLKNKVNSFLIINLVLLLMFTNFLNTFMIIRTDKSGELYLKEVFNGPRWEKEYLPVSTVKGFLNVKQGIPSIMVVGGKGKVEMIDNEVPNMIFEVSKVDDEITLKLPRVYYLGYEVVDEDGKVYPVTKSKDGLIDVKLENDGEYELVYTGTSLDKMAYLVNIIAIVGFIIFLVKMKKDGVKNGYE